MTNEEKKLKRQERKQKIDDAKSIITNWLEEVEIDEPEVVEAIKLLVGTKKEKKVRRAAYMDVIDFIEENGTVSEDDIWNKFKMGRTDMRNLIKKYVKNSKGNEINWIIFDVETEDYTVIEKSTTVPENWDGPLPKE